MGQYTTAAEYEAFFTKNYVPIVYDDVKETFETFLKERNGMIFHEDYQKSGNLDKKDFKEHLTKSSLFTFQDTLTEAFYEKNPAVYEAAFEIFEENGGKKSDITKIFDDTYNKLYNEFLDQLFDDVIIKLK